MMWCPVSNAAKTAGRALFTVLLVFVCCFSCAGALLSPCAVVLRCGCSAITRQATPHPFVAACWLAF